MKLGDIVKDRLTGYKGVAVAKTEWLFGCVRYGVQAEETFEGKPVEEQWFDEARLDVAQEVDVDAELNRPQPPENLQVATTVSPGGPPRPHGGRQRSG